MSASLRHQQEGQASHHSPTIADLQSPRPLEHQLTEVAQSAEAAPPDTEASQAKTRQAMTGALQEAHQATAGAAVRLQADQATVPAEARATAEEALAEDTVEAVRAEAAAHQA